MSVNEAARQKKAALEAELAGDHSHRPLPPLQQLRTPDAVRAEIEANEAALRTAGGRYRTFYQRRIEELHAELSKLVRPSND